MSIPPSANADIAELGAIARTLTTLEALRTGNGLKISTSARLKMAVLEPMASAIETIAVAAKPGFCRSIRRA
jgi:hypothetical protein